MKPHKYAELIILADHGVVLEGHWKKLAIPGLIGDKGFSMFLYVYNGTTGTLIKEEAIANFDIENGWSPRDYEIKINKHSILPNVRLEYRGSQIWMRDIVDEHNRSIEQTSKE